MGRKHAGNIQQGLVKDLELVAVCDSVEENMRQIPDVKYFTDSEEMIRSGEIDALLIATPHYFHTSIGIDALEQGLHVLVEKPISVHKADCERLLAAYKNDGKQVFAAMFNERTNPQYAKLKQLIEQGEFGEIRRIIWIITSWFRPQSYYKSAGWRATWAGEGGGVLLNQCPHQLDLYQWFFGMPRRVRAFCDFGRYHNIEVEDDVTAYMEYDNGCKGIFITTTGEAPGTNRLEIAAERGKIILEGDDFTFIRNEMPMSEWSEITDKQFGKPPSEEVEIKAEGELTKHVGIMQNFTNAILHGEPLLAPGVEGIHSVELANAMLYSTFTDSMVELPLDGAAYEQALKDKAAASSAAK